jgi:hypothetical protein
MSAHQPATSRWGCLLVLGIILLLPGVCSLAFAFISPAESPWPARPFRRFFCCGSLVSLSLPWASLSSGPIAEADFSCGSRAAD